MKQKQYSESFKTEAVKLVKGQGRSIQQAAKELGISVSGLRKWVDDSRPDRENNLTDRGPLKQDLLRDIRPMLSATEIQ